MLPTYPEKLLDYAVDGVIQAASRHQAEAAERLGAFARKQAAREREHARMEAAELRTAAAFEGYREGLLQAFQAVSGLFEAMRGEHVALQDALSRSIHEALRERTLAPDAALAHLAQVLADQRDVQAREGKLVVHVPRDQPQLVEALEQALTDVEVRLADRRHLTVEVGQLAYELDTGSALAEDIETHLAEHMPQLRRAMCDLADRYALQLQRTLEQAAEAAGLRSLEKPDATD